ncbi:MAG: hypothetical protein U0822_27660 [Anaerolineae bacterium]
MPYYQTTIRTYLSPGEVEERLRRVTRRSSSRPPSLWRSTVLDGNERAQFVGTIGDGHFVLQRDIGYRNSFLPTIRGKIEGYGGNTEVKVRMHLHPAVAAFLAAWIAFVGQWVVLGAREPLLYGMLAFAVVLACAGFFPEALMSARMLRKDLEW